MSLSHGVDAHFGFVPPLQDCSLFLFRFEPLELIAAVGNGTYIEPTKLKIADYVRNRIDQWEAAGTVTARTAQRYRQLLENQIAPQIGRHVSVDPKFVSRPSAAQQETVQKIAKSVQPTLSRPAEFALLVPTDCSAPLKASKPPNFFDQFDTPATPTGNFPKNSPTKNGRFWEADPIVTAPDVRSLSAADLMKALRQSQARPNKSVNFDDLIPQNEQRDGKVLV